MDLQVVPVAIAVGACRAVASDNIVGVCNPEGSWGLVSVEQTPGSPRVDDKVALDEVVRLNSIFDEH